MAEAAPVRVLVVHRGFRHGRDEAREVLEMTAGLVQAAVAAGEMEVTLSDLQTIFRMELDHTDRPGGWRLVPIGRHRALRTGPVPDVAHIHLVVQWTQLLTAIMLRLRGTRIVFSPMSMLGDDFAGSSWFRSNRRLATRVKPAAIAVLRLLWRAVTHVFVVASEEERQQARLPTSRCVLLPLVTPDTPLSTAILREPPLEGTADPTQPIAFLTRFDPHRKGLDRMVAWLDEHRDALPRPAVLLLAPVDGEVPKGLQRLIDDGTVLWDSTSRGEQVLEAFASCRGAMLLSRWDGQPRVLREAAIFGLPTLSTVSSHFREVVDVVGAGVIVDGDDPADIQDGFEQVAGQQRQGMRARALLDRNRVGDHLHEVLLAVARRESVKRPDYYDQFGP